MAAPTFTIDSAVNFIRQKVVDFHAKAAKVKADLIRAGQLKSKAMADQRPDLAQAATEAQTRLKQLLTDQLTWERRIHDFADFFGIGTGNTLGAIPIALGVAAIPLAIFLWVYWQDSDTASRKLDLVEKGLLTGQQYVESEKGFVGQLADIGTAWGTPIIALVGLAAVLYFGFGRSPRHAN